MDVSVPEPGTPFAELWRHLAGGHMVRRFNEADTEKRRKVAAHKIWHDHAWAVARREDIWVRPPGRLGEALALTCVLANEPRLLQGREQQAYSQTSPSRRSDARAWLGVGQKYINDLINGERWPTSAHWETVLQTAESESAGAIAASRKERARRLAESRIVSWPTFEALMRLVPPGEGSVLADQDILVQLMRRAAKEYQAAEKPDDAWLNWPVAVGALGVPRTTGEPINFGTSLGRRHLGGLNLSAYILEQVRTLTTPDKDGVPREELCRAVRQASGGIIEQEQIGNALRHLIRRGAVEREGAPQGTNPRPNILLRITSTVLDES